jgi:hypothetical protein
MVNVDANAMVPGLTFWIVIGACAIESDWAFGIQTIPPSLDRVKAIVFCVYEFTHPYRGDATIEVSSFAIDPHTPRKKSFSKSCQ